jgi:hypothetical protein
MLSLLELINNMYNPASGCIYIKTLTGKTITIKGGPSDMTANLKDRVGGYCLIILESFTDGAMI